MSAPGRGRDCSTVPVARLREYIRAFDAEQVRQLIACEEHRGGRSEALEILHDRLCRLERGADPSGHGVES